MFCAFVNVMGIVQLFMEKGVIYVCFRCRYFECPLHGRTFGFGLSSVFQAQKKYRKWCQMHSALSETMAGYRAYLVNIGHVLGNNLGVVYHFADTSL